MVPLLFCIAYLNRALVHTPETAAYNFEEAYGKIGSSGQYSLIEDKETLSAVVREVFDKGVVPSDYAMDLLNFAIMWYFLAGFMVQSFALLYYRKFRES